MRNIHCQETLHSTMGSEQSTWTLNRIIKMLEDRAWAEALRKLFRIQDLAARADFQFGMIIFGHR